MQKISREELKKEFPKLVELIQKNHHQGPEVEKALYIDHIPVKGLCHTRGCFMHFDEYFIQYEMDHMIIDVDLKMIGRRVAEVILYDNFIEYEAARVKAMSKEKDQTGLNFN